MRSKMIRVLFVTVFMLVLLVAGSLMAGEIPENTAFLRTELAVSPSSLWHSQGSSTGLVLASKSDQDKRQPYESGYSSDSDESAPKDDYVDIPNQGNKVQAGLLSLVLPGAGQYYNGKKKKAYIMAGAEMAVWSAYLIFNHQGNSRMDDAETFAGIYAGTSGEHETVYWQSVGRHMDNDAYNDALLREARALEETATGLIYGDDSWQWVNNTRRQEFNKLRADGNTSYKRRDFMILFAVINRAVSVVDAVIGAGNNPGSVETEVLGVNLKVEMLPSWNNPGAQCVVSRSF